VREKRETGHRGDELDVDNSRTRGKVEQASEKLLVVFGGERVAVISRATDSQINGNSTCDRTQAGWSVLLIVDG
jgi:hypothetical protein